MESTSILRKVAFDAEDGMRFRAFDHTRNMNGEPSIECLEGHGSAWSRFVLMSLLSQDRELPERLWSFGNRQITCWIKLKYDSGAAVTAFLMSFAADAVGKDAQYKTAAGEHASVCGGVFCFWPS